MVSLLLPTANDEQAGLLAAALEYHALAVEHACGFIGDSDGLLSVEAFCANLHDHAAQIFESTNGAGAEVQSLTRIYRDTITVLDAKAPQAAALLKLASFLGSEEIPQALLALALTKVSGTRSDDRAFASVLAGRALRVLEQRYLVTVQSEGVGMHSLTQALVNGLLGREEAKLMLQAICEAAEQLVREQRQENPDLGTEEFGSIQAPLIWHLLHTMSAPASNMNLDDATMTVTRTVDRICRVIGPGYVAVFTPGPAYATSKLLKPGISIRAGVEAKG
jgi:hypothetical protein